MYIPSTIDRNCFKAYESKLIKLNNNIQSSNFAFLTIKSLKHQCIEHIANHWQEYPLLDEIPLLEDRQHLLDILPTSLPLPLTIPRIQDEVYWKKCYISRWPRHDYKRIRNWKKTYCEHHLKDYFESLQPNNYNFQEIKLLIDCFDIHIERLEILEMITGTNSKIPLNDILSGFTNLTELTLRFKQTYANNDFRWNMLKTSSEDINLLVKGLAQIRLKTLRIINSDIDCLKLCEILKGLIEHELAILDFSNCKIGNDGARGLGEFLQVCPVQDLILTNNRITSNGAQYLAQSDSKLQSLNLDLNAIEDSGGNRLLEVGKLINLSISGCKLTGKLNLPNCLRSFTNFNRLNVSNNRLKNIGKEIFEALKTNHSQLIHLDVRMTEIDTEIEAKIQEEIEKNRRKKLYNLTK